MRRAAQILTDVHRKTICQAVAEAEAKTTAEIVPVVAAASGRYDRAEDIAGLWLGVLAMLATWLIWPRSQHEIGSWGGPPEWAEAVALTIAVVGGFVLGTVIASRCFWLRRLFTPRNQMRDEVLDRARQVFFDQRVHHAQSGSGLFIYVSLYERQAVVLADAEVMRHVPQETLDKLCQQLTGDLRTANLADSLTRTIQAAGVTLATVLPRLGGAVNELPDALVVLDVPE